jgi:hypothetical protein
VTGHRRPPRRPRVRLYLPTRHELADALRAVSGCTGDLTWWFKTGGFTDLDEGEAEPW